MFHDECDNADGNSNDDEKPTDSTRFAHLQFLQHSKPALASYLNRFHKAVASLLFLLGVGLALECAVKLEFSAASGHKSPPT